MATQTATTVEQKLQELRELYVDAPELSKIALERMIPDLQRAFAAKGGAQSAGRIGARQGKVSELTLIVPITKGAAKRLRGLLRLLEGSFTGADRVGTVHDMRFVFLDNDTKLLFATAYDGDWDPYIDDFATKIPNDMDLLFGSIEGWPGIHSPAVKEWIVKHQVPAQSWYVSNPNLTVAETRRLERVNGALETFLDKIG
jgi:hypothetical protein